MYSEPQPKVICKNLQDIIKESSMFSTKRNSIQDIAKKQSSQRVLKSQPRDKRLNERCYTSINHPHMLQEVGTRLNTSVSKHSLKSKQKINILHSNQISSDNNNINRKSIDLNKTKNALMRTSGVGFYPMSIKTIKKQSGAFDSTKNFGSSSSTQIKSLYFNQVDAVFTELEDFIRQIREKICQEMDFLNEQNLANKLANQLTQLSYVFKNQMSALIERSIYYEAENDFLKPKNRLNENKQNQKNIAKVNSELKQFKIDINFQQQLSKIQQFMQRQNTINSTINSEPFEDPYIPTETDAELLSMLVYKNKFNSTKRKIQNTYAHGQQFIGSFLKSAPNTKDVQPEYSFRNGNYSKQIALQGHKSVGETSIKKKKNNFLVTEKSTNKENKQKSIYQIVLQDNRRLKGNWAK